MPSWTTPPGIAATGKGARRRRNRCSSASHLRTLMRKTAYPVQASRLHIIAWRNGNGIRNHAASPRKTTGGRHRQVCLADAARTFVVWAESDILRMQYSRRRPMSEYGKPRKLISVRLWRSPGTLLCAGARERWGPGRRRNPARDLRRTPGCSGRGKRAHRAPARRPLSQQQARNEEGGRPDEEGKARLPPFVLQSAAELKS